MIASSRNRCKCIAAIEEFRKKFMEENAAIRSRDWEEAIEFFFIQNEIKHCENIQQFDQDIIDIREIVIEGIRQK